MSVKPRYIREHVRSHFSMRSLLLWIFEIAVAVVLGAVFSIFFCKNVDMTEGSMEPTVQIGDTMLVNTMAYKMSKPKRNDMIVFRSNNSANASLHVKRVIGLPGETIQISDGQILINGATYMEKKDLPSISYAGLAEQEIRLGDNEYFVLGDNRNNSSDSRDPVVGNIHRDELIGKAWMRIYPFDQMCIIKHQ